MASIFTLINAALLKMALRETLGLVLLGLAIGIPDAIAALAGSLPARRASHIDPMTALRHE